jgi:hypothetical protein
MTKLQRWLKQLKKKPNRLSCRFVMQINTGSIGGDHLHAVRGKVA